MKVFLINNEDQAGEIVAAETKEEADEFYSIECGYKVNSVKEVPLECKIWHSFYFNSPVLIKLLNESKDELFEIKRYTSADDCSDDYDIVVLLSFERILKIEKITRPYIF